MTRRNYSTILSSIALQVLVIGTAHSSSRISVSPVRQVTADLREVLSGDALKKFEHKPWLTGSSIALLPDESRLIIADTQNNAVVVVDTRTSIVQSRVAVGQRPERLVVSPDGLVYVTNRGSRSFSVIDPRRGLEIRAVEAGVEPFSIALTSDTRHILVTSSATGELLVFDRRSFHRSFAVKLGTPWPAAVAVHPDGKHAYVTHMYAPSVSVVDIGRRVVDGMLRLRSHDSGLPQRMSRRGASRRQANLAFSATVSPGGKRLFVAHMIADTGAQMAGLGRSKGYGLGSSAPLVATVSAFDLESKKLIQSPFQAHRRGVKVESFQDHQQMLMMSQPMAVVHSPSRSQLFMVGHGCDRIAMLNSRFSDPVARPLGGFQVGQAPKGLVLNREGTKAYVHNAQSFSVSFLQLDNSRQSHHDSRGTARATLSNFNSQSRWQRKPVHEFKIARDPLPRLARQGRRLFTYSLNARVGGKNRFACASCHPDGRHDGLTWNIAAGPRKTPILAARVQGTGPFNWLGTESSLADNIKQTVRRLGGHGINDKEAAAISSYIGLYMDGFDNPHRGQNAFLVARGQQIFEDNKVGCSTCHDVRNNFTDGSSHNVGTTTEIEKRVWRQFGHLMRRHRPPTSPGVVKPSILEIKPAPRHFPEQLRKPPIAYNTPSLRHVWAQVSYLHDGSQKTLKQLVTSGNRGDRMGTTSHLSEGDLDALVAYLKSL